jgi:hypothetical protein
MAEFVNHDNDSQHQHRNNQAHPALTCPSGAPPLIFMRSARLLSVLIPF